jgi:hypothetical protein
MKLIFILFLVTGCSFLIPKDSEKDKQVEKEVPQVVDEEPQEVQENKTPVPEIPEWYNEEEKPAVVTQEKVEGKLDIRIKKTCKDGVLHYIIKFSQGDKVETKCGTLWGC